MSRTKIFRNYVCEECGKSFSTSRKGRFCSNKCRARAKQKDQPLSLNKYARRGICLQCGSFTGKRYTQFCSRECAFAYKKRKAEYEQSVNEYLKSRKEILSQLIRVLKKVRRKIDNLATCEICGTRIEWHMGRKPKYCSKACARKTEAFKAQRLKHKVKRRARVRSLPAESIDPIKVFERDGWLCKLCGIKTPKAKRGSFEPDAPELDHIKPLSKGGHHTWSNVQCLCRQCNYRKGDSWG